MFPPRVTRLTLRVTQRVTPVLYRCFPKPQRVTRVTLKVLKTNLIFIFEKLVLRVVIYKIISIKLVLDQVLSTVLCVVSHVVLRIVASYIAILLFAVPRKSVEYKCPQTDLEEKASAF